jgi:hypothetical protein
MKEGSGTAMLESSPAPQAGLQMIVLPIRAL